MIKVKIVCPSANVAVPDVNKYVASPVFAPQNSLHTCQCLHYLPFLFEPEPGHAIHIKPCLHHCVSFRLLVSFVLSIW
jgi:hypothetical protein